VKVPFVDLKRLHHEIGDELRLAFARVLENSSFILGPEVERFEAEFARYCGAEHCVALNNGTSAIHSVLVSLGIGPGDEVITVPHTFIATAEAISAVGATPVFIDIDPISYCMNPELIEPAITKKTRAIMPVHLYGQMADMGAILEVANAHNMTCGERAHWGLPVASASILAKTWELVERGAPLLRMMRILPNVSGCGATMDPNASMSTCSPATICGWRASREQF
jgi:dTDP-4-amino-4,6-dideoxygalactose transaminase